MFEIDSCNFMSIYYYLFEDNFYFVINYNVNKNKISFQINKFSQNITYFLNLKISYENKMKVCFINKYQEFLEDRVSAITGFSNASKIRVS